MSCVHSDNGSADRIGSFNGRSGSCFGEQASLETDRDETFSKVTKGEDMGATHEQVNLMLHLYELRREAKLREAREWVSVNFHPKSPEDAMRLTPPGSKENAYMRMVMGYWEMVASIANRGLVDEELFFENSGEQWGVWEAVKDLVPTWRAMFANPQFLGNLEEHCKRLDAWREKRNPGSVEVLRKVYGQMNEAMQENKSRAASN
ncbi:MAG TPA: hypothetical protein VN087_16500 [Verrucomicrobiae bacterium]|nr:hypothetical protein [Verrucomicrobiae bacterium]